MLKNIKNQMTSFLDVWLLYNVLLFGLIQDIEYSSLCYTVGPCYFRRSIYMYRVYKLLQPIPLLSPGQTAVYSYISEPVSAL